MEKFNKKNVQENAVQHTGETQAKPKDRSTVVGEVLGSAIGTLLCVCGAAIVVALTTKFIFWLF